MSPRCFILILTTTFVLLSQTQCTVVDVDGRCPDKCNKDTLQLFRDCAPLLSRGCEFAECSDSVFACRVSPSGPPFYELGDMVSITDHPLNKFLTFPISLDGAQPKVDIYFLIDATFTNRMVVNDAKRTYSMFLDRILALGVDAQFGLGIFRDESELSNGFANLQSMTKKDIKVVSALKRVEGTGGLDYFESNLAALYQVATNKSIWWRKDARKIVVMAAAFVGHEPTCTGKLPRLTRQNVAETLRNASIFPVLYSGPGKAMDAATVPYGCEDVETVGSGQGSYIVKETGGVFVDGVARMFDVDSVYQAVTKLLMDVSVDFSSCKNFAAVNFNTTFQQPLPLGQGVSMDLALTKDVCKLKASVKCSVDFMFSGENGGSRHSLKLAFENIKGCSNHTSGKK